MKNEYREEKVNIPKHLQMYKAEGNLYESRLP